MKKLLPFLLSLSLCTLLFAACVQTDPATKDDSATGSQVESNTSSEDELDFEPVTLKTEPDEEYLYEGDPEFYEGYDLDSHEEEPGDEYYDDDPDAGDPSYEETPEEDVEEVVN